MINLKMMLDIASGKFNPDLELPYDLDENSCNIVVHTDRCFGDGFSKSIDDIGKFCTNLIQSPEERNPYKNKIVHMFCKSDVWDFMDNFPVKAFNHITCNRFFEHLEYCSGEVGRMIEACNVITRSEATMDFIVPNHEKLAKMILQENHSDNDVMVINTEFCNIRCDPHLTIWTPKFARRYIETEATWTIGTIKENYNFAGRSIYMKVYCQKVNLKNEEEHPHEDNYDDTPF